MSGGDTLIQTYEWVECQQHVLGLRLR